MPFTETEKCLVVPYYYPVHSWVRAHYYIFLVEKFFHSRHEILLVLKAKSCSVLIKKIDTLCACMCCVCVPFVQPKYTKFEN